jgi:hypothetical protein
VRKLLCITGLALASLTSFAATPSLGSLKVRIDQDFRAGLAVLPAGNYSIRPLGIGAEQPFLFESETGPSVLVSTMRCSAPSIVDAGKPSVVLNREGDSATVMTRFTFGGSDAVFCVINPTK